MKIANRPYFCPLCGHKENHSTNHQGEIYCDCHKCGSNPLYCAEVDAHAGLPFVTAVFRFYQFSLDSLSNEKYREDREAYEALCARLVKDCEKFHVIPARRAREFYQKLDGTTVKLYNPEQWPDQFVSNVGRLRRWFDAHCPNRFFKWGYYLEIAHHEPAAKLRREVPRPSSEAS